jgi:hypothetical protein
MIIVGLIGKVQRSKVESVYEGTFSTAVPYLTQIFLFNKLAIISWTHDIEITWNITYLVYVELVKVTNLIYD